MKAFIDIDGVLLDTCEACFMAFADACVFMGLGMVSKSQYLSVVWSHTFEEGLEWLAKRHGPFDAQKFKACRDLAFDQHIQNVRGSAAAAHLVCALIAEGYDPVLCTAARERSTLVKLKALPVSFSVMPRIHEAKKHTLEFWKQNASPGDILLDDSENNIAAAREAGLKTIHWNLF